MTDKKNIETLKRITFTALLCAIAYVVMLIVHIPLIPGVDYLTYDPKDVIIAIGGFIYGPLTSLAMSLIVSLAEMLTVSHTGLIGFTMNIIASVCFALPAALIYKNKRTFAGAILGLCASTLTMTASMLLWNYAITPLYTGMARADIAKILPTVFLPFNLFKAILNSAITMFIYRPFVLAMRKAKILSPANKETNRSNFTIAVSVISLLIIGATVAVMIFIF